MPKLGNYDYLAGDDPDVPLKLQDAIAQVHNAGSYRDRIDSARPCFPPLGAEDQQWANLSIAVGTSEHLN